MDDFVNEVNRLWEVTDSITLAAYVLWKLNWIHPFINGNGRTARVACYYIICLKSGGWLHGSPVLPALIKRERKKYVKALQEADKSYESGDLNLKPLHSLLAELLEEQLQSTKE